MILTITTILLNQKRSGGCLLMFSRVKIEKIYSKCCSTFTNDFHFFKTFLSGNFSCMVSHIIFLKTKMISKIIYG